MNKRGMKAITIILMTMLLLAGCQKGPGDTGKISIRIGGDIPVGTVKSLVTATNDSGDTVTGEIEDDRRYLTLELEPGTWNIGVSFIGRDGRSHVERDRSGVKVTAGMDQGLTIRLPEDKESGSTRTVPEIKDYTFEEPDRETVEKLAEAEYGLTLWHHETGRRAAALDAVLDEFNRTNGYGITVTAIPQGTNDTLHLKAMSALMAGNAPDIVEDERWRINEYVPSGKLISLEPYITDGLGMQKEDMAGINPVFWHESAAYDDGNIYSASLGKSGTVLYYNKSMLKKYNLEVPTTVGSLTEAAGKISKDTGKPSFAMSDMGYTAVSGAVAFGVDYDPTKGGEQFFEGKNLGRMYNLYEWWEETTDRGWFRSRGDDRSLTEPYLRGDLCFFLGQVNEAYKLNSSKFETGITSVPKGKELSIFTNGPVFAGISTGDPLRDTATSIVLEWFWSPEAGEIWASITGELPSNCENLGKAIDESEGLIKELLTAESVYKPEEMVLLPYGMDQKKILKALALPLEALENTESEIDPLIDQAILMIIED